MCTLIGRNSSAEERIFRPVTTALYERSDANGRAIQEQFSHQQAASSLIVDWQKPLPWRQRFWSRGLNAHQRFERVLYHRALAIKAEQNAQWTRADFFWNVVYDELDGLAQDDVLWSSLMTETTARTDMTLVLTAAQFRAHVVNELFIDVHSGFYNGLIQATEKLNWRSRAFVHLDYIYDLLEYAMLSKDELALLITPASRLMIELLAQANKIPKALESAQLLLGYFPESIEDQTLLARLHFGNTVAQLRNRKSERSNQYDAEILWQAIISLEAMLRRYRYNLSIYHLIAQLYHIRAIKLAATGALSAALVDVQKALTFFPSFDDAYKTRADLLAAMQQLQTHMKAVEARLSQNARASLNAKGEKIAYEARRGATPMQTYAGSDEAKATANGFATVQARFIWQQIGLAIPEEQWDEQALALRNALNGILADAPEDPTELPVHWHRAVAADERLAMYDVEQICAFLTKQRAEDVDVEKNSTTEKAEEPTTVATAVAVDNPPILTPVSVRRKMSSEPFAYWLFSGKELRVKLQALAATILVVVAIGLTVQTTRADQTRDTAYENLIAAEGRQDYPTILAEAERFLANASPLKADARTAQVEGLYHEAFVYWYLGQKEVLSEEALAQVERYKSFNIAANLEEEN